MRHHRKVKKNVRLVRLFRNQTRSGDFIYFGTTQKEIIIPAGTQLLMLKSWRLASNGHEIWNLYRRDDYFLEEEK